jgi:hypothetical protein
LIGIFSDFVQMPGGVVTDKAVANVDMQDVIDAGWRHGLRSTRGNAVRQDIPVLACASTTQSTPDAQRRYHASERCLASYAFLDGIE